MEGADIIVNCSRLPCYQGSNNGLNRLAQGKDAHSEMDRRRRSQADESSAENQWIEHIFLKRECIKFIASERELCRCVCGRFKQNHAIAPEGVLRVTYPAEKWSVSKHTETSPTDAYGTIEFQGGPHPTKAQYIRLSYDTKPDKVLGLLHQFWGLEPPKLLISVHGGIANFDLQPKLRRVWRQGLLKAAKTTGAWIITGGTNTGVMKHVGDALGDTLIQSRSNIVTIGVVPWGVVHNREELLGKNTVTPFHAMATPTGNNVMLNSNHSYFLLSDDGTIGRLGYEAILRKKFEKYISQQISTRSSGKDYSTPVVYLILEGGCNTIRTVLECVTENPPFPVVIIDGSGRAADLLAFAHKYANDNGTMPGELRDQLLLTIQRTFSCSTDAAESTFIELMMCMKNKKHLITVFRIQEQTQDIDRAILAALLKSQNASAPDQLSRALAWDRADIAQSHIFVYGQEWPEGALDQAMMDALVSNRVDFVKRLIENGVNMHKWLTIERLEELYNLCLASDRCLPVKAMFASTRHQSDASSTLKHLLSELKMRSASEYHHTLMDIGQVINKLMGGAYRSTYCRKKFRMTYNSVTNKSSTVGNVISSVPALDPVSNHFRYPFSELMIWAILLQRHKMALFMWERGEEALAKALVACKLYKSMAKEAEEDELEVDVANKLQTYSKEFANLSTELLEHCFKTDDDLTQLLLTYELSNWSNQTCMSLAMSANHWPFIASTGCQIVVSEMWMGGLRTRKYANPKVILGIFCFPLILLMDYRSVEELQMMPQTVEEHIQDLKGSDSESDSDSDNDFDVVSVSSKNNQLSKENPQIQGRTASSTSLELINSKSEQKAPANTTVELFVPPKNQSPLHLGKKIYEFYMAPITKFWMNVISYSIFLLIFVYLILIRTPESPSWLECYVIICMIGFTMEMVREFATSEPTRIQQKMRIYFFDLWNAFGLLTCVLFFIGFTLRLIPGMVPNGRVFYCLTVSFSILRIMDFFAVSQHLGPLVHIIRKNLMELLYFTIFLLIILIAFGTFHQAIRFPDEDFQWELVRDIFLKPYFMLYGEVYAEEIWPECGPDQPVKCVPGRWLDPVAMTMFLIVGIILLLSVLIAVFNGVFNRTHIHSKTVWKFQRYNLVIEYESKPVLPSPLIIFCHVYLLIRYLRRKWLNKKKLMDNGLKLFLDENSVEKLHDFEEECMEMYYREKENKNAVSVDSRMKQTLDKLESMNLRIDDIHQKENYTRASMMVMDRRIGTFEDIMMLTLQAVYDLQRCILPIQAQPNPTEVVYPPPVDLQPFQFPSNVARFLTGDISQHSTFNEKKLGPFTEYQRLDELPRLSNNQYFNCRSSPFPKNSSNQRECCHAAPVRTRRYSCSAAFQRSSRDNDDIQRQNFSERHDQHIGSRIESYGQNKKSLAQDSDISSPEAMISVEEHHPRSNLPPLFLDPNFNGSRGLRSIMADELFSSPLSPIITPTRTEYTSITDNIDTSCMNNRSPPGTPTMLDWSNMEMNSHAKRKKGPGHHKRKRTQPNDQLKKAEETVHKQMEFIVHKRIRQLSLTETESSGNLAKHALESLEDGVEEEDAYIHQYHSDEEATGSPQATSLKSIKSEPFLKKKALEEARTKVPDEDDDRSQDSAASASEVDVRIEDTKFLGREMPIIEIETSLDVDVSAEESVLYNTRGKGTHSPRVQFCIPDLPAD